MQSFDICDAQNDRVLVIGPEGTVEIPYEWGLAGPDGAWFKLKPSASVSEAYVAEAKACLRRNRDVVQLKVERVRSADKEPPDWMMTRDLFDKIMEEQG